MKLSPLKDSGHTPQFEPVSNIKFSMVAAAHAYYIGPHFPARCMAFMIVLAELAIHAWLT